MASQSSSECRRWVFKVIRRFVEGIVLIVVSREGSKEQLNWPIKVNALQL